MAMRLPMYWRGATQCRVSYGFTPMAMKLAQGCQREMAGVGGGWVGPGGSVVILTTLHHDGPPRIGCGRRFFRRSGDLFDLDVGDGGIKDDPAHPIDVLASRAGADFQDGGAIPGVFLDDPERVIDAAEVAEQLAHLPFVQSGAHHPILPKTNPIATTHTAPSQTAQR